jgi:hypothetical protein
MVPTFIAGSSLTVFAIFLDVDDLAVDTYFITPTKSFSTTSVLKHHRLTGRHVTAREFCQCYSPS